MTMLPDPSKGMLADHPALIRFFKGVVEPYHGTLAKLIHNCAEMQLFVKKPKGSYQILDQAVTEFMAKQEREQARSNGEICETPPRVTKRLQGRERRCFDAREISLVTWDWSGAHWLPSPWEAYSEVVLGGPPKRPEFMQESQIFPLQEDQLRVDFRTRHSRFMVDLVAGLRDNATYSRLDGTRPMRR